MSLSKTQMRREGKNDPDNLKNAIEAVRRGMAVWTAVQTFGLPKSTIHDQVKRGYLVILPAELEVRIADWIGHIAKIGYGQMRNDIIEKVQVLVNKLNITTPWPEGRPTEKGYRGYMERHPNIHYHMVSALCKEQASISFDNIYKWFLDLHNFVVGIGLPNLFEDPTRIYNCDETGFPLAPKPKKIIIERGGNHHYQTGIANTKAQITSASTVGHYTKPLVVYPGVQPQTELCQHFHDTFNEGLFGNSESGWMDTKLFAEWLEHGFNEDIKQRSVTKPVILFIDGAKVHLSIEASEFCTRNNIILYTLYPNATHLIQPLDLALMGSMKNIYKEEMRKWLMRNIGETFDKYRFVEVFRETCQRSCTVINAVQSFEKAGIVPWNPDKVKTGKLYHAELYTRQEPMPHVAADNSINEPRNDPQVASGTANMPEKVTEKTVEKVMEKRMEKEDNKPMVITVGKKCFRLIEVDDEKPKKMRDEMIEEVLEVPKPRNVKVGPCRVPGLPRCVSSQEFRDRVKEIKDRKK